MSSQNTKHSRALGDLSPSHPQLSCLAFGSCGFPVAFLSHSSCFKPFHPLKPLTLTNYLTSYMTEKRKLASWSSSVFLLSTETRW